MTQNTSPLRALLNVEASASVPKLSNAQMLDAPQNSAIRDIWLLPPDNPKLHAGRKVAVVDRLRLGLNIILVLSKSCNGRSLSQYKTIM